MTETVDLVISRAARWQRSLWLLDGNQPVDLSAKRVELVITPQFGFGTPIATLTSLDGGGIVKDNASKGAITIDRATTDLPAGRWNYFLRIVNGDDVTEYRRGTLTILDAA